MAKNTKALSGPAKRKYFRAALQADAGVTPDAAKRLTEKFDGEVSQMRVRQHKALPATSRQQTIAETITPTAIASPLPEPLKSTLPPAAPSPPAFDPHAFSLIVVMTKLGADGLRARLEAIDDFEHLKALARAQHIAVDSTVVDASALRAAIVTGTAQRIADRRAAAS
jgi:hypothetical protein